MPAFSLQELSDRAEISDVFTRYATGIDTRDWALWRTCFTDDAEFCPSARPPFIVSGADAVVRRCKENVEGFDATQHTITNHKIELDGDTAHCTSYVHAQHVLQSDFPGGHMILAGIYTCEFIRTAEGWKIRKYSLTISWSAGDSSVWGAAKERAAAARQAT